MRRWIAGGAMGLAMLGVGAVRAHAQSGGAGLRAITLEDQFAIRAVEGPRISPEGKWVAYTVTTTSMSKDETEQRIWMVPFAGGDAIALTSEGVSSGHPEWSPDGKFLAFLSARKGGTTQVWLLNRLGGEATQLTDFPQAVDSMSWSPDGKRLALVMRDATRDELEAAKDREEGDKSGEKVEKEKKAAKPWVIDRLQFKSDEVGYLDHRRTHLYVFDVASKKSTQVTSGDFDDAGAAWSPDGTKLAFASNRTADADRNYNDDIWVVAADNTDKGAQLTQITTNPGEDHSPAWSPDGKWIAYVTQTEPKLFEYATKNVGISPAAGGGAAKVVTREFDRNADDLKFSADSQSVFFIADDDGTQNLCKISVNGGAVARPIGGRVMVYSYSVGANGEIAAQIDRMDRPSEIYAVAAGAAASGTASEPVRITHTNDALISQLKISSGEYVHFKSKDGTTVAGYLYKPLDYVAGKKAPTILIPHGGPVWAWYAEFQAKIQWLNAAGYAVLTPNPRGSTGYGQKFAQAIFADWGNKDFQDDMAIVDYAVAQGIADQEKLGVGGHSYGAISTDFIIAQTTRFKGAISDAGVALHTTGYGHDQYQKDYELELGRPWENHAAWDKVSMFWNVAKVTTPTLFMGGAIDWNVPIIGGEQMYQAMKSLGRETELVVYPDEYHEFRTPSHIKDRLIRQMAWWEHHVKGSSEPATPVGLGSHDE
ncbi:MAG TPA: S9 family peptidase [Candidatus Acidoferrum sp.]|nr:S9 family peptidase [Candidatus Acidoferrum sp.]